MIIRFHWECGKCGSRGLYKDVDDALACLACGNRYYETLPGVKCSGVAPKKVQEDRPPVKYESGHHESQRMENTVIGVKHEVQFDKNTKLPVRNAYIFAEKGQILSAEKNDSKIAYNISEKGQVVSEGERVANFLKPEIKEKVESLLREGNGFGRSIACWGLQRIPLPLFLNLFLATKILNANVAFH